MEYALESSANVQNEAWSESRYMKKVTVNGTVAIHELYLYRGYL